MEQEEHRIFALWAGEEDSHYHKIVDFVSKSFTSIPFFTTTSEEVLEHLGL